MGHRLCRCPFLYVNTGFSSLAIKNQSHICRFYSVIVTGYAYGFSRASLIAFFKTAAFNPKHYNRLYSKKTGAFLCGKLLFFYYSNIMPKGPLPLEYEHPSAGTVPKETICRRCLFA